GTTKAHICRATLEAIAFSIKDITDDIGKNTGNPVKEIKIDGGASANNLLAQFFADILDCKVARPASVEATSLGAAQMAGLFAGIWTEEDFENAVEYDAEFTSSITEKEREARYADWCEAVKRSANWIRH
ncbi:MAG: FGGY-family carbohydrate kinase, partial [Christensenellales bacterium]